jgi:uncharacterized damage-inducible protein DinB
MATQKQEIPVTSELDRFIRLHDGMAQMNRSWLELAPPDRLDWVPSEAPIHRFGDGRTPVTIRNLFIHVAVAEHVWISALAAASEDDIMPSPSDAALYQRLATGDLVAEATTLHAETLDIVRDLSPSDLNKTVVAARRRWDGMAFLWGVHAHRAFHLGHLDLYLRLNDRTTPEFFVFHPDVID